MAIQFPPVRACIFDVDGTLINSEDVYTEIYNNILREYGKPDFPWAIKAIQQSRGTSRILDWANLPLSAEEFRAKEKSQQHLFTKCNLLPGVVELLEKLTKRVSPPIKMALATSADKALFDVKTTQVPNLPSYFAKEYRVFGDDPDLAGSDTKPMPDIFLLALKRLNESCVQHGERPLDANECIVFEDSIAGVEAGRRAGMRVVWVPHKGLAQVCKGREQDVLMGRTEKDGSPPDFNGTSPSSETMSDPLRDEIIRSEDDWAEMIRSLENFQCGTYGIKVSD
ncbi:haloacid dehalogenase-like hydrolase [Rhizodiscina lignyota]|uniref:Haloacid dehalogenase-like hydrolase n=1 Tax=Rhizodiscina lignyota TaxID=1504668 RepID=A0A9P4M278_9PEZI|nr:haloacid dehalogenase-like hydrolase [Rhizodiscina lignyota]